MSKSRRILFAVLAIAAGLTLPLVQPTSALPDPPAPVVAIDSGAGFSCALVTGGTVRCWGRNFSGELGYGHTQPIGFAAAPRLAGTVDLGAGRLATAISVGQSHSCALLDDATVRCWGWNGSGQLGNGASTAVADDETPGSLPALTLPPVAVIDAGAVNTCAVLVGGEVRCWGDNSAGQLGLGHTAPVIDAAAASAVSLGRPAVSVSVGNGYACALLDDATVRCWGANNFGQLGQGNTNPVGDDELPSTLPAVDLGAGRTAVQVVAGSSTVCAVLDDGALRCWGDGSYGLTGLGNGGAFIGDNETPGSQPPVSLGGIVASVSVGDYNACALLITGAVRCWGISSHAVLGLGVGPSTPFAIGITNVPSAFPTVDIGAGRLGVAVGVGNARACAIRDGGEVLCWGGNWFNYQAPLGYPNHGFDVGWDNTPGSMGAIDLTDPLPNQLPVFGAVTDIEVEATGPGGAVVEYETPTATDPEDGPVPVTCTPASGSLFPIGETIVTCEAVDSDLAVATVTFTVTVNDDIVDLVVDDLSVPEAPTGTESDAVITVRLTSPASALVQVRLSSVAGTASSITDYRQRTNVLVKIPVGSTSATATWKIRSDELDEADETFFVNLSAPVNATISDGQGVVTIVDDDGGAVVSAVDNETTEADGSPYAHGYARFELSTKILRDVAISWRVVAGTATAADARLVTGIDIIRAGSTSVQRAVTVLSDELVEPDETFTVEIVQIMLAEGIGDVVVGDASATVTIHDDDAV